MLYQIWLSLRWPLLAIGYILAIALAVAIGLVFLGEIGNALGWWVL